MRIWECHVTLNLKVHPQWYSSSSQATPPKPTSEDQVFKQLSLWGPFSSKPLLYPLYYDNYIIAAEPADVK